MTTGAISDYFRRQRSRIRRGAALQGSSFMRVELAKGFLALVPAAGLGIAGAPRSAIIIATVLGFSALVLWTGFLLYHALTAQSRHADRVYRLITRKHLSKEYRDG